MVLAYDLLEDRRTIDVIITKFFPPCLKMRESFQNLGNILLDWDKGQSFFPPCLKMAESFQNLVNILLDWDKGQKSLAEALNRLQKQEERR